MNKAALLSFALLVLALDCSGSNTSLTGQIVAYNPLFRAAKNTFAENGEETVFRLRNGTYVKLRVVSFKDTDFIGPYLKNGTEWHVKAHRDASCDESLPRVAPASKFSSSSATYILTEPFKDTPPDEIRDLKCYTVR